MEKLSNSKMKIWQRGFKYTLPNGYNSKRLCVPFAGSSRGSARASKSL